VEEGGELAVPKNDQFLAWNDQDVVTEMSPTIPVTLCGDVPTETVRSYFAAHY